MNRRLSFVLALIVCLSSATAAGCFIPPEDRVYRISESLTYRLTPSSPDSEYSVELPVILSGEALANITRAVRPEQGSASYFASSTLDGPSLLVVGTGAAVLSSSLSCAEPNLAACDTQSELAWSPPIVFDDNRSAGLRVNGTAGSGSPATLGVQIGYTYGSGPNYHPCFRSATFNGTVSLDGTVQLIRGEDHTICA